jgi:hypothetical protein
MLGIQIMKAKLIKPSWWYLMASIPLVTTFLISERFLADESYKYTLGGGLRISFVLFSVQLPSLLGLFALVAFILFLGSAFTARLHDIKILKVFSLAVIFCYCLWGLFMAFWLMIK